MVKIKLAVGEGECSRRQALLGGSGAYSPEKNLKSWHCFVAPEASFGTFGEQIELSNPEYFRAYSDYKKTQTFSTDSCKNEYWISF